MKYFPHHDKKMSVISMEFTRDEVLFLGECIALMTIVEAQKRSEENLPLAPNETRESLANRFHTAIMSLGS